jgi:hypothetical protein
MAAVMLSSVFVLEGGTTQLSEKFQVSRAARNFRAKRERLKIPSAGEGGLTVGPPGKFVFFRKIGK